MYPSEWTELDPPLAAGKEGTVFRARMATQTADSAVDTVIKRPHVADISAMQAAMQVTMVVVLCVYEVVCL